MSSSTPPSCLVEGQPARLQPFERLVIELHFEGNRFGGGNAEGRGGLDTDQRRKERRQVVAHDLRRRPPQRLVGGDRLVLRLNAELAAEIPRLASRQQEPAQDRPESLGRYARPGRCSDRLGGRVGLLRRDSALLHREARDVACGEHVGNSVHAAMRVDRNEAVHRLRQPVDRRALESWKRDHAVRGDAALWDEVELSVCELGCICAGHEAHVVFLQQRMHGLTRGRPEQLQRFHLGRHERELDALHITRTHVVGGEERQLIGG